jgi:AcrR family transcriptional regulator
MTPKARVSHSERRMRSRGQVLAAATRLLQADQSYTELSVEQVLREAGISRATFYAHFGNKGELLSALAEDVIDSMLTSAAPWWTVSGRPDEDALAGMVATITDAYLGRHAVMAAVVEVATYDIAVRTQLHRLVNRSIDALAQHISTGQDLGFVDPDHDPARVAGWIVWMTERGLYKLVRTAEPDQRRRYLTALTHTIWNALYTVPTSGEPVASGRS